MDKSYFKLRIEGNEDEIIAEIVGNHREITAALMTLIESVAEAQEIKTVDYVTKLLGAAIYEENSKPFNF